MWLTPGITDEELHVFLYHGDKRTIDDIDHAKQADDWCPELCPFWEEANGAADKAVRTKLDDNAGVEHGNSGRRCCVTEWRPGVEWEHLNEEPKPKGEECISKDLEVCAIRYGGELIHIEGEVAEAAGACAVEIHRNDPNEDEHRADEQVEHELHGGVIFTNRTPDTDEGVHWNEGEFEEDVEE